MHDQGEEHGFEKTSPLFLFTDKILKKLWNHTLCQITKVNFYKNNLNLITELLYDGYSL